MALRASAFEAERLQADWPDYPESSQSIERLTGSNRDSAPDSRFMMSRLARFPDGVNLDTLEKSFAFEPCPGYSRRSCWVLVASGRDDRWRFFLNRWRKVRAP